MLQSVFGQNDSGVPQPEGCGALLEMSDGMEERAKNHTLMPSSSHSTTHRVSDLLHADR